MWSGERLAKVQTTTRPDHVWPEVWTKMDKAAQNREEQEWKNEEPKLDNDRRLRGIHFRHPTDEEYKETITNARKKLEVPMEPAMPCKREICLTETSNRKLFANPQCISESSENKVWLHGGIS